MCGVIGTIQAVETIKLLLELGEPLVNRLLLLAEGDAGRLGAISQSTRLDKIVHESVDMFDAVAESQGVQLSARELPVALVPGDGDPPRRQGPRRASQPPHSGPAGAACAGTVESRPPECCAGGQATRPAQG